MGKASLLSALAGVSVVWGGWATEDVGMWGRWKGRSVEGMVSFDEPEPRFVLGGGVDQSLLL